MRTTTNPKTISYLKNNQWSPDMSFEQFEKLAPNLNEISSVMVKEVLTKEEVRDLLTKEQ